MIERRYFDILILALKMRKHRDNGDTYQYEAMLMQLALQYSDLFKGNDKFDLDRSFLIEALTDILPEYFGNSFDRYGAFISND